jgi:hypothetical protein
MKAQLLAILLLAWSLPATFAYTISAPPGFSLIANQLNNANTLDTLFPDVPDGCVIYKYDCAGYVPYTYDELGGSWNPSGGTLSPGEGAVFYNPTPTPVTLTISGTSFVPVLPLVLPCGCGQFNLVSCQTNAIGTFENITGLTPTDGAQVLRHIPGMPHNPVAAPNYIVHTFSGGFWSPGPPAVAIGEAVWLSIPCPCLEVLCPTNKLVECGSAWIFDAPVILTNCCTNTVMSVASTTTNGTCPEIITRIWIITDDCSNSVTCTQIVSVVDTTASWINCASNKVVECGAIWAYDPPATFDFCCNDDLTIKLLSSTQIFSSTCTNIWEGVWQVTDCCSNSVTCTQSVTVVDTTPPVITCAANKAVIAGTAWNFDPPTAFDVCCETNVTISVLNTITNVSFDPCQISYERIWQAEDCCTNTAQCSQTVTVLYNSDCLIFNTGMSGPSGNVPIAAGDPDPNYTLYDFGSLSWGDAMVAGVTYGPWLPNSTESQWLSPEFDSTLSPIGLYTYRLEFWLCCTNNAQLSGRLAADDHGILFFNGTLVATISPPAYGNWTPVNLTSGFVLGMNTVEFQVTNSALPFTGFRAELTNCLTRLTVDCPPDKTIECGSAWDFDFPIISGSCCTNTHVSVLSTTTNGVCPEIITRIWKITDDCANSLTCTQVVSVVDTTPPLIICPLDIVVTSCTNIPVSYLVHTTNDCSGPVTLVCDPPSDSWFQPGLVTTVECVATDDCGNVATCSFTVTVLAQQTIALFNTGVDAVGVVLPPNSPDPHYELAGIPPSGGPFTFVVAPLPIGWLPNDLGSQWISPTNSGTGVPGTYVYRTKFTLDCTNTAIITGQWSVDDTGAIVLNGGTPSAAITTPGAGIWHPVSITSGFVPGLNTLDFYVTNVTTETGLRVDMTGVMDCCPNTCLEITCPTNMVIISCTNVVVNYSPLVTNHCTNSTLTTLVCHPPSGSTFTPGATTVVNCTASDNLGNSAHCSFTIQIVPPMLSISIVGGDLVITWSGGGILQEASSITGPWSDIPPAISPHTVPLPLAAAKFYRLRCD